MALASPSRLTPSSLLQLGNTSPKLDITLPYHHCITFFLLFPLQSSFLPSLLVGVMGFMVGYSHCWHTLAAIRKAAVGLLGTLAGWRSRLRSSFRLGLLFGSLLARFPYIVPRGISIHLHQDFCSGWRHGLFEVVHRTLMTHPFFDFLLSRTYPLFTSEARRTKSWTRAYTYHSLVEIGVPRYR